MVEQAGFEILEAVSRTSFRAATGTPSRGSGREGWLG
jgi:hypothetical protein